MSIFEAKYRDLERFWIAFGAKSEADLRGTRRNCEAFGLIMVADAAR